MTYANAGQRYLKAERGFTLLELMMVVAIVGILAAIAYPSYQDYMRKTRRAAAQSLLMEMANKQQQALADARAYALGAAGVTALGYGTLPKEVAGFYTIDSCPSDAVAVPCVTTATTPPTFTLVATPAGSQTSDGTLTLNNLGAKTRAGNPGW